MTKECNTKKKKSEEKVLSIDQFGCATTECNSPRGMKKKGKKE